MSDTPTPEQQEVDIIADLLGRYAGFTPTADMVDDEIRDLHQLGFRVYPEPGEDTQPTPSHSATMRELEQTRAERDAAVARAEAAEADADMLSETLIEVLDVLCEMAEQYQRMGDEIAATGAPIAVLDIPLIQAERLLSEQPEARS